jgi:cytochrome c1
MKKVIFFVVSLTLFTLLTSNAAIYKGQKVFVKECVECHSGGQVFIAKKKISTWKKLMKNKGKPLAKLHLENAKAKKSWKYFKSSKYTKKTKHLKQFLVEYAKDSGNVPACN